MPDYDNMKSKSGKPSKILTEPKSNHNGPENNRLFSKETKPLLRDIAKNGEIKTHTDSIYVKPDEASQAYGVIEEGMYAINMKGIKTNEEGMILEVGKQDRSLGLNKKGVVTRGAGGYEINANQDLPEPLNKNPNIKNQDDE